MTEMEELINRQRAAIKSIENSIGMLINLPNEIIKLIASETNFERKVVLLEATAKIVKGETK